MGLLVVCVAGTFIFMGCFILCYMLGLFSDKKPYDRKKTKDILDMIDAHQKLGASINSELDDAGKWTKWAVRRKIEALKKNQARIPHGL